MTKKGVAKYRKQNPGSKLKTAVTEKKPTGKRASRRKSYCARSAGQMKKFPKAAKILIADLDKLVKDGDVNEKSSGCSQRISLDESWQRI